MSCSGFEALSWSVVTIRHDASSDTEYRFSLTAVQNNRFTGTVTFPAQGEIRGVCRGGGGAASIVRLVMTFPTAPRDSIHLVGVTRRRTGPGEVGLSFTGTYTNLFDPGDTGSGGGGQTPL